MTDRTPPTTTDSGIPPPSDEHSLTAGSNGPTVLHDHYLVQKFQHFNRERIPACTSSSTAAARPASASTARHLPPSSPRPTKRSDHVPTPRSPHVPAPARPAGRGLGRVV